MAKKVNRQVFKKFAKEPYNNIISNDTSAILSYHFDMVNCNEHV